MAPKSQSEQKKKKQRVEKDSPLDSRWSNQDTGVLLRKVHDSSEPYRHIVLEDLCTNDRMRAIHDEITVNMKANFKETDLFKVFQTGDLAALSPQEESVMPHLMSLRKAIYSTEFREFVTSITGCGDLNDRVDCSCNAYAHSCHLLCHDDVIGTRRVSYIIYLSDPDDPWQVIDGGAVELYPLLPSSATNTSKNGGAGVVQGIPSNVPTRTLLPTFNTMLIFAVQPGCSYHSVQEVFSSSKPRLSISGWYHASTPPVGSDMSSLKQIMTLGDDHRVFAPFTGAAEDAAPAPLSKTELKELGKWINPNYLTAATMKDINEQFCANSSLQLNDFVRPDLAYALTKAVIIADETQHFGHGAPQLNYTLGTSSHWELVGPPHKRRHLLYRDDTTAGPEANNGQAGQTALSDTVGAQLDAIRRELFRSELFARYLQVVTSLQPLGYKDEVRRFRPGLDYTVAHYGVLTKQPRLDATLCFINDDAELQERVMTEHRTKSTAKGAKSGNKNTAKGLSKSARDNKSAGESDGKAAKVVTKDDKKAPAEQDDDDEVLFYFEFYAVAVAPYKRFRCTSRRNVGSTNVGTSPVLTVSLF
jgi:Rps23 Pro-64 3,4-dihydroxylase Tpa1-like proline 4-hydroxylase